MAQDIAIYLVMHQPRRLKLPAQPIPKAATADEIEHCLFDEQLNKSYFHKVANYCYYPATQMFIDLASGGFKISLGFSVSVLRQAEAWDSQLFDLFQQLIANPNVELVNVEPHHSFLPLLNLSMFAKRMSLSQSCLEKTFRKRPSVTDTTEMLMSDGIYHALDGVGFDGAFLDGRPWVMGWREPTHLYHKGKKMMLMTRHYQLSDDIGYRFSNKGWWGYPLFADSYARWLSETAGDFILLAWDYETFGEHHSRQTGIFDFMQRLPEELSRQKITTLTPSEAIAKYRERSFYLPLPAFPCTWAGDGGLEFFLGNDAQQAVFQLMLQAFNKALITRNSQLLDLAIWLMQSDNLHLIQWFGRSGPDAEVSAYFTPKEWWDLGPSGIVWQMQQVYKNFIQALDAYF